LNISKKLPSRGSSLPNSIAWSPGPDRALDPARFRRRL
jgi:hypothetical protein